MQIITMKNHSRALFMTSGLLVLILSSSSSLAGKRLSAPNDSDYPVPNEAKEQLGKLLFYDKILSGNENTSCATCHHPLAASGDGLSLPVGEGGRGLGITRDTGSDDDAIIERVPRNAPHLYNLGAHEFTTMFHDGRLEKNPDSDSGSGFDTPAGLDFPIGVDSALAAQAFFPPTSNTEMAGQTGENEVADLAAAGDLPLVWELLAEKVKAIKGYHNLFEQAYPLLNVPSDINFVHIANAIGAFEAAAYRADNSPFDRYLRGERTAMSSNAKKGYNLFKGKARCSNCHNGKFQTDHKFHALGIPQIGPGKGDGYQQLDDFGREQVTGDDADRYKFRTPTLRNIAITGPWGHDGAYNTLKAMIKHHLHAKYSLKHYDTNQAVLPSRPDLDDVDFSVYNDTVSRKDLAAHIEIKPVSLNDRQLMYLIDFLNALTDPASLDMRSTAPASVPSGLPLAE